MFSKQTSFLKSVDKSPPLSSKFRINADGHLIPLLTKKWRVQLSSESVRHVQLFSLWDGRVASDTLNVFVSWQLHNISWQHVVVSRFNIIYCQSKTVHRRFTFPRVAFLRRLCRPLLNISGRSARQTFSVQWLLHSVDRFLNEFWFLFHWIRGTLTLWKFWQSFTSPLEHISLVSLQPSNPKWIVLQQMRCCQCDSGFIRVVVIYITSHKLYELRRHRHSADKLLIRLYFWA